MPAITEGGVFEVVALSELLHRDEVHALTIPENARGIAIPELVRNLQ